jgi:multiple sugar transport system ATP-binding protein
MSYHLGKAGMASITFDGVTKRYPDGTVAVDDLQLEIEDGELMILVGPSGCGKTTALRMIAGLEDVTEGEIRIGDEVVNDRQPKDRDIAMVFQNYALYPHMTVAQNMGFALKMSGLPKAEIAEKVRVAAEILDLTDHLQRKPARLSGGQRQRVAMGRAIVRDPEAFLMDEPLSNLDAKLRVQMRAQIARMQQRLGTTTVYVTHDQTEALTLGHRVAVMRGGTLQQVGSPAELYARPVNLFVAGFIGSPAMNLLVARVDEDELVLPFARLPIPAGANVGAGDEVVVGLRPQAFQDAALPGAAPERGVTFTTRIDVLESMGSEAYAYCDVPGAGMDDERVLTLSGVGLAGTGAERPQLNVRLDAASRLRAGDRAELWLDPDAMHLFDPADGRCLTTLAAA